MRLVALTLILLPDQLLGAPPAADLRTWLSAYEQRYDIRHDPNWRRISGWRDFSIFRPTTWDEEADNQDRRSYVAEEGMASPEADFINFGMAYFTPGVAGVGEDSIKCRMSAKYRYFQGHFPEFPEPVTTSCKTSAEGFLDDIRFFDHTLGEEIAMGPISDETVEGFELLYATPGTDDIAEVAGHLVLRIRLRNYPEAAALGSENPHDLVIAFLADTQRESADQGLARPSPQAACAAGRPNFEPLRETIQALHGLSGGLPTVFDRQTLAQVIKSYTYFQDRNLLRYRLLLSPQQKSQLLSYLFEIKKSYKTRYYFFDQNCAAILLHIIGKGIQDESLADIATPLQPPNSLISLLVRRGLAERVYPSFYSYRKKGQGAQERMSQSYGQLPPESAPLAAFLSHDEQRRSDAYLGLGKIIAAHPEAAKSLYEFLIYGQIAELSYQDLEDPCQPYTSLALESARKMSRMLLAAAQQQPLSLSSTEEIRRTLTEIEQTDQRGSPYTGLLEAGAGWQNIPGEEGRQQQGFYLKGALFTQDMGSPSRMAMQRSGDIKLGTIAASSNGQSLHSLRITALKIEKFRERLDTVPSLGEGLPLGIHLRLFDYESTPGFSRLHLGAVGGLLNLWAGPRYENHLYMMTALSLMRENDGAAISYKLGVPWHLKGQLTLDKHRVWIARIGLEGLSERTDGQIHHETRMSATLAKKFTWSRSEEGEIVLGFSQESRSLGRPPEAIYQCGLTYRIH